MNKSKVAVSTIVGLVIIGLFAGGVFYYKNKGEELPEYDSVIATVRDLEELVSVTGAVEPAEEVQLSFEVTGRIDSIFVKEGDRIKKNAPLIKLKNDEISSELARALSDLENEKARLVQLQAALSVENSLLSELERGTREEEVQVAERRVESAEKARQNAEIDLVNAKQVANQEINSDYSLALNALHVAFSEADNAVTIKTTDLFQTSFSNQGELIFSTSDPTQESQIRQLRASSQLFLAELEKELFASSPSHSDIDSLLSETETGIQTVLSFLNVLAEAVSDEIDLDSTLKATSQTNISTTRNALITARSGLTSAKQTITSQEVVNKQSINAAENRLSEAVKSVELATDELKLSQAKTLPEIIESQQAKIRQAEANILAQEARISASGSQITIIRSQLEKTILRSPIDGIVTNLDVEIGEIVTITPGQVADSAISVISDNAYEIIAYIPEVDIAKIEIGDTSEVTLDAFSDDERFIATVDRINPAETVIEGVSTYKIVMVFDEADARIKSGMTANIDLITDARENVLAIPQRAVLSSAGIKYVRVLNETKIIEQSVETGLISWDGQIEIISGIADGTEVITFLEEAQ